ncbi:Rho guanine nucleotide exchange factor 7 [Blattella germanica]|nr:Rho guanine nucleotide exchange factor 7 [Blattella germanica]
MKMSPLTPRMSPLTPRVSVPQPSSVRPTPQPVNKGWSMSCLRPSPPLRPCLALGRDDNHRKSGRSTKKQNERSFEEDAQILRVIEAYCTSAKTRYTVNSGM